MHHQEHDGDLVECPIAQKHFLKNAIVMTHQESLEDRQYTSS